jgi:hypothetical protein
LRPYSPGGALHALASALTGSLPQGPSAHRLRRGLPGYLILFAPHAVAPQRQYLFAQTILTDAGPADRLRHWCSSGSLRIPPLHPEFHRPLPDSSPPVRTADPELSPGLSPHARGAAYAPFTPSDSGQRSHPLYYRGCWHRVSRCFLPRYRQSPRKGRFVPGNSGLHPEGRPPARGVAASGFRPLRKIPHCCLP